MKIILHVTIKQISYMKILKRLRYSNREVNFANHCKYIPYSTKHWRDKTFAVRSPCEYSRKKLLRLYKKLPYPCHCIGKFVDKTFTVQGKTAKSANVLSLECFVLYGIILEQIAVLS